METEVRQKIETGIDKINKMVIGLKADDFRDLSERLRNLRHRAGEFEYWLDEQIRKEIEDGAKQKAAAILEAGFSFDSITIDKVQVIKKTEGPEVLRRNVVAPINVPEDDIPF